MPDPRLVELETRLTYQEATLQELSDIVGRQQLEIDRLTRLCRELAAQVGAQAGPVAGPVPGGHEVPPHY